jgi:site-specific DNA recombinase
MTIRCAIFIRPSKSREGLLSAESQEMFIRKYIKQYENWEILKIYHDNGFTAKDLTRPEVQDLLHDAKCELFDRIVVYRYDRLTRNPNDYCDILKSLEQDHNVKIVSATETPVPENPSFCEDL